LDLIFGFLMGTIYMLVVHPLIIDVFDYFDTTEPDDDEYEDM